MTVKRQGRRVCGSRVYFLVAAFSLIIGSNSAHADVVAFDNMTGSSGNGGQWSVVSLISGPTATYFTTAQEFTSAASGYIDHLILQMANDSAEGAQTVGIGLYSNNGGTVGSLIETLSVTTTSGGLVSLGSVASGNYGGGAALSAGTSYWLAPVSTTGGVVWSFVNAPSSVMAEAKYTFNAGSVPGLNFTSGTYSPSSSVQFGATVDVVPAPVPLPASVWLFGLGAAGFVTMRRLRQSV